MSAFLLIIAIVAVSTLGIHLLFGTIRAGLSSVEREERLPAEAANNLKAR